MRKRQVSLWSALILCFLLIIVTMIFSSVMAQHEYQTFYQDFSDEYSLLIRLIEVKQDVQEMYRAAAGLSGESADNRGAMNEAYDRAYGDAQEKLALLAQRLSGDTRYEIVDISNMFRTFHEEYTLYLSELNAGYTIYLTTDVQYLHRLQGYIEDELSNASGAVTLEAKAAYDDFYNRLGLTQKRGYLMLATASLVSIMLAFWMTRHIAHPLQQLVTRMKRFAASNEDEPTSPMRPVVLEVAELLTSYDGLVTETMQKRRMEQELNQQQLENAQTRILLKSAELEMLQMQMNPHFLFNTLNSIGALAEMENAPRTGEMVSRLADILRYSTGARMQFSPLCDELKVADDYVAIQQTRFGGKLSYLQEVEEATALRPVPCMIIQPLIENAMQHGFDKLKEGDRIEVSAHIMEDGALCIRVRDNGRGMTPERLREVLTPVPPNSERSRGIGLENVLQRMRLLYGEGMVDVQSSPGMGTSITLRVPDTRLPQAEAPARDI